MDTLKAGRVRLVISFSFQNRSCMRYLSKNGIYIYIDLFKLHFRLGMFDFLHFRIQNCFGRI